METDVALPSKVMKLFREHYPYPRREAWNPNQPEVFLEEANYENRPYILPLVILKTHTCRWLQSAGGCTMCNFQSVSAYDRDICKENILNQVKWAMNLLCHFQRPYLHLTSSGSFLDPDEIDDDTLVEILRVLDKSGVKLLSTESRPGFLLNEQRLELMRRNFNGALSIGIGLESSNDFIRNFCLNKGFKTDVFVKAVSLLRKHTVSFHSYVLLGKPFLSTREDIDDAIRTIQFTINLGGIAIVRLVNLQPYTLIHWLFQRNMYKLPRLWSALEVLRSLADFERQRVWIKGIDKDIPPPIEFASNCENCTSTVHNAIVGWNITRNYQIIEQIMDCCECKAEWEKGLSIDRSEDCLETRVPRLYGKILHEICTEKA
jgi:radical SAM enzyme (TIGR01210 family)